MRYLSVILSVLLFSAVAHAELKKETIEYKDGDTTLEGYLVYDQTLDLAKTRVPGVVVVHDWMGLGDYAKTRADQLAQMGYIVLAADIYGKGVRPQNSDEAAKQATYYKEHRDILRSRAQAAFNGKFTKITF